MGRGVNNSGVIDCNQIHFSFLIYILSTFFNLVFFFKPILTKAPAGSNAVDYILKTDRSNLLPLGESGTRQYIARREGNCRAGER